MSTKQIKLDDAPQSDPMGIGVLLPQAGPQGSPGTIVFDTTGQATANTGIALQLYGHTQSNYLGQSFYIGAAGAVLSDVQMDLSDTNGSSDTGSLTVELWSNTPNYAQPGTMLYTLGTISASMLTTNNQLLDVPISAGINLTADTRYWIELTDSNPAVGVVWDDTTNLSGTEAASEYNSSALGGSGSDIGSFAFGMQVTVDGTCYAAGTHILTDRGEVRVEQLQAGDHVMALHRGGFAEVKWIGHRTVDLRRHPRPQNIDPVRIAAGAFGDNLPHRDLLLSPDHCVFVDGALLPVRYLINGATIRQETRERITYFHIELDAHDVVLAEGLPAETFLDVGNRRAFRSAEGPVTLHPDFAVGATLDPEEAQRIWQENACAPSLTDPAARAALHKTLLDRAIDVGHVTTEDPDLHLLAAGEITCPEMTTHGAHFQLPPETERVYLISRSVVPSHLGLPSQDGRRLGIGVTAIALDGVPIDLADPRLSTGWAHPRTHPPLDRRRRRPRNGRRPHPDPHPPPRSSLLGHPGTRAATAGCVTPNRKLQARRRRLAARLRHTRIRDRLRLCPRNRRE